MTNRTIGITLGFIIILIIVALTWTLLSRRNSEADYKQAQQLLSDHNPTAARALISNYRKEFSATVPSGPDWLLLEREALTELNDGPALALLALHYPRAIENDESLTIVVASGLLALGRLEDYDNLKQKKWAEKQAWAWSLLDVDKLLVAGEHAQAQKQLEALQATGKQQTGKLLRLALLQSSSQLTNSWKTLQAAPDDSRVLSYRGQFLEQLHRPYMAADLYQQAIKASPEDSRLVDQLAEFYVRQGNIGRALTEWQKGVALPQSDFVRLKILFWSRVGVPFPMDWSGLPIPTSELAPLIQMLVKLPATQFWDEQEFSKIPNAQSLVTTRQEVFWLRLAELLRKDNQVEAATLLENNAFTGSLWAPQLAICLRQILSYRRYGVLNITSEPPTKSIELQLHHFFAQLDEVAKKSALGLPIEKISTELDALLNSTFAFPAAFLAAGWPEAALILGEPTIIPNSMPQWLAYAYTQAIRITQGPLQALAFAFRQPSSPPLSLLMGELMIATGSIDAGLNQLNPLIEGKGEVSQRAAWLTAIIQFERGQLKEAKATVNDHPTVAETAVGQEILARIALAEGDQVAAAKYYEMAASSSLEAQLFLAGRFYEEKNDQRGKELTDRLKLGLSDKPQLRAYLEEVGILK